MSVLIKHYSNTIDIVFDFENSKEKYEFKNVVPISFEGIKPNLDEYINNGDDNREDIIYKTE